MRRTSATACRCIRPDKLFSGRCRTIAVICSALAFALSGESQPGGEPLLISNVNVVDVVRGRIQPGMTVVIRNGTIEQVRRFTPGRRSAGAAIVDGTGKFLIPGLWDMHAHLQDPARDFNLFIANGILGARNMGGIAKNVFEWRDRIARGELSGPRIFACGPIVDGPKPTNPPISVPVHDAASARSVVRSLKAMGADFVKTHDGVPREAYFALAQAARQSGLPLAGHVPPAVRTIEAIAAGQRSIEHDIGLRGMSLAEASVMQTEAGEDVFGEAIRTKNFSLIPESIANKGNLLLDRFSEIRAQELYRAFARNGTHLTPTLVTKRSLAFVDDLAGRPDPRSKYVSAAVRERWKPENGMLTRYRTPAYIAYRRREYA